MAKQKTAKSLDAQARLRQSVNTVLAALLCILIGLLVGFIVLLIINPEHAWDQGFVRIIQGGFYDFPYGVGRTLVNGAPLIMTGLSVAFAFKTGLFNIGAAGQYTLGAFAGCTARWCCTCRGSSACWHRRCSALCGGPSRHL